MKTTIAHLDITTFGDLKQGPGMAFIPALGGALHRLVLPCGGEGVDLVEPLLEDEVPDNPWYKQVPLFPFPNRLEDGRYSFNGKSYAFPVNEPARNNALHGFLFGEPPALSLAKSAPGTIRVRADYAYDGRFEWYPFPARIGLDYVATAEGTLEVEMTVTNTGTDPMPVGFGFHPYYTLGCAVDDLVLSLPEVRRLVMTERALPTGEEETFDGFSTPRPIGETRLDDCLRIMNPSELARARLVNPRTGRTLDIHQDTGQDGFNYLQIFTPPGERSIALEPVTAPVNAFNQPGSYRVLEAGKTVRAGFGLALSAYGIAD